MRQEPDKKPLYDFLRSKRLFLTDSKFFKINGDYFETWSNKYFQVRFIQDRHQHFLDVATVPDKGEWYTLDTIRSLFNDKVELDLDNSFPAMSAYLIEHFSEIEQLFQPSRYPKTKKDLERIGEIRVKLMFPNLKKERKISILSILLSRNIFKN